MVPGGDSSYAAEVSVTVGRLRSQSFYIYAGATSVSFLLLVSSYVPGL